MSVESFIPTTSRKRLKLTHTKRARKPIPEAGVEVGTEYWAVKPYRRPRRIFLEEPAPDDERLFVVKYLSKNALIQVARDAVESLDVSDGKNTIYNTITEAADIIEGAASEYGESRDNMPVEGSEMWEKLDEIANAGEDVASNLRFAADEVDGLDEDGDDFEDELEMALQEAQSAAGDALSWDDV